MIYKRPKCLDCKHYSKDEFRHCEAYPKKDIPDVIWFGEEEHDKVRPDQEGNFVFVKEG